MIGLRLPLVEELHELPLFITMRRAFDEQILKTPLTVRKLIILILSNELISFLASFTLDIGKNLL
jgi:hypothetical protein